MRIWDRFLTILSMKIWNFHDSKISCVAQVMIELLDKSQHGSSTIWIAKLSMKGKWVRIGSVHESSR
jgi:hypothetical protein